ncbi:hypothetical protein FKW77_006974 [Venturia effusa]|uniref:Phosphatidylinositol 3-kinase VPS34 n=1 Tax=Venturia effusa TaxID=50376 RepID=A0A517LHH9_9PEZI|nr:hypothetical protein FKW77_006974 [Venturia effusa]
METFTFATSSDLEFPISVKINTLDGFQKPIPFSTLLKHPELRHKGSNISVHSELYVTAQLWADSKPLTVQVQTAYKVFKNARVWNEWLTLPILYSNVPPNTQLAITVWDLSPAGGPDSKFHAVPFGGTTIPLFDHASTLHTGRQRCKLHRNQAADGWSSTTTPHMTPIKKNRRGEKLVQEQADSQAAEMERLELLMKKHEMGEVPENKWLDQLVFRQIEKLERASFKKRIQAQEAKTKKSNADEAENEDADGVFYLYIEFPRFDHPVIFTDKEYPAPPISTLQSSTTLDVRLRPPPEVSLGPGINADGNLVDDPNIGPMIRIYDPEVGIRSNPIEDKHRRLLRSVRSTFVDRDLKPNAQHRDQLNVIISYGPLQELTEQEKDLVWKFRHHLTREKRALTKFAKSVSWGESKESREATQMLSKWTPIDVDDALELLGPNFEHPAVRTYAVDRLRKSADEELLLYLLQLVQALRFELQKLTDHANYRAISDSPLANFLISRAATNFKLGNYFHWYLMVECQDDSLGQGIEIRELYKEVDFGFMTKLDETDDGKAHRKMLLRQAEMITVLSKIAWETRNSRQTRDRKVARLRQFLADPENELIVIDPPLPLFLDPTILVTACIPGDSICFKSTASPLKIQWKTASGSAYPMLFKVGDDMRQDQLVIQIIMLMDRLLQSENLDLKLTPYHCLATAPAAGAVEFVSSIPLSDVDKGDRSIINFLKRHNPDPKAPFGVRKETMETYIKSCAGYCVITYILGVGDRHLDNLMITPSGHFFHIDFSYILGRDPKPFAPLMKLSTQMVEGMGGMNHDYYHQFKQYCFTAYAALRKSSNLILNLFALISQANIQDIRAEPDRAVLKVQERLHLDKTEQEATQVFDELIQTSTTAWAPKVIDTLHTFTQTLRG